MESTNFRKLASEIIAQKAKIIDQVKFTPWNQDSMIKEIESMVMPVLIQKVREQIQETTRGVIQNLQEEGFTPAQFMRLKQQLEDEIKKANMTIRSKSDFLYKDFFQFKDLDEKVDKFQQLYCKTYSVQLNKPLIESCGGSLFDLKFEVKKPVIIEQRVENPEEQKQEQQKQEMKNQDNKLMRLSRNNNIIHIYNYETNRYSRAQVKDFIFPQKYASYQDRGNLYFSGGFQEGQIIAREIYKVVQNEGKYRPLQNGQMLRQRYEHCLIVRNSCQIYNLGGCKGSNKSMKYCEVLNLTKKEHDELPQMQQSRRCFAACLFKNDQIYVFCGKNKEKPLSSIQKLDLEAENMKWKKVELKNSDNWVPRAWISATALNDEQILIYGHQNLSKINFLFQPQEVKVFMFKSEIVPETSGYWCPAIVNKQHQLFVFSYQQVEVKIFKFWNKHWEKLTLN